MRLHLIALPHTRVAPEFCGCAYTSKALKFCRMMDGVVDVVLYAPEGSTTETAETVECLLDEDRQQIFGADDPARLPAWPTLEQAGPFNSRAAEELARRYEPGDLVLLTGGLTHAPIMAAVEAIYCEPGVGYEGIATDFCAFESYAWRHYVYARRGIADGRWFDAVIPNYFDPDEFQAERATNAHDFLLFFGRVIPRKGPDVALEIATALGLPLVVAGAGVDEVSEGLLVAGRGTPDEVILRGNVHYAGVLDIEERAHFLRDARALLAPTRYIEPFGGVAVEAMLSGTPVVATDWGAFAETIEEGVSGFRFGTLREAVLGTQLAMQLEPEDIRRYALERYSLDAVRPLLLSWFDRLSTLRGRGWYEMSASAAIVQP